MHNGFDADAVWRAFSGPATSKNSGAFARAMWHASPAGVADSAALAERRKREPDSKNLRAWLRTYRDVRKAKDQTHRKAFMSLLGDYLVTVPGTPTVERWLGEIALQELKHRAHKLSGLSAASGLRLVKVDLRGRRPVGEVLDPVRMLTKEEGGVTSAGQGSVAWPASKFAIEAQSIYREFFGTRAGAGRDLMPLTPEEQSKKRHQASKPALGRLPAKSDKTVEALRKKHSNSLKAGMEAARAGAREGHLGELPMPAASSSAGTTNSKTQMLQAVREATQLRLKGAPQPEAASEMPPDKKRKLNPIEKQAHIQDLKRRALVNAAPGTLPDYVGPRGDGWRENAGSSCKNSVSASAGMCPGLHLSGLGKKNPIVYWGPGASDVSDPLRCGYLERLGGSEGKKLHRADIVVVDSVAGRWESSEALGARLWGKCLVDLEWLKSNKKAGTALEFRSVFTQDKTLYLSDDFRKQWPEHARLLVKASVMASSMTPKSFAVAKPGCSSSSSGSKSTVVKKKCFTVILGKKPETDKKGISLLSDAERVALPAVSKRSWGLEHCVSALTLAA